MTIEVDRVKLQLLNVRVMKSGGFWYAFNDEYSGCLPLKNPKVFWQSKSEEEMIKLVFEKLKTDPKGVTG